MTWRYLAGSRGSDVLYTKDALVAIIIVQYIFRFWRFIPLSSDLKKTAGLFAETAWAGAAYYLLWFVLASHVSNFSILVVNALTNCCYNLCNTEIRLANFSSYFPSSARFTNCYYKLTVNSFV